MIEPKFVADLDWAKTEYDSIRGPVKTDWRRTGDSIELTATVPVGTTAKVVLPVEKQSEIQLDNQPLKKENGVESIMVSPSGKTVCTVGSGIYQFRFPAPALR